MTPALALMRGVGDLARPRVFGAVLKGIGLTILLFVALQTGLFWALQQLIPGGIDMPFIGTVMFGTLASWASLALFPVIGFFLMAPVAAGFSGLWAENIAAEVEAVHYPDRQGQDLDFWDSVLESLPVMALVLAVAVVSLLLTPFLGPLVPVLFYGANGWLLGREFFQMAARRHLSDQAAADLRRAYAGRVLATGVAIAFLLTVPLVNIAVPVLAAAVFTHLFQLSPGTSGRAI